MHCEMKAYIAVGDQKPICLASYIRDAMPIRLAGFVVVARKHVKANLMHSRATKALKCL